MVRLTPATPPIGGRYHIKKYIGAGGMQRVYEAEDTLFHRSVALKQPKDDAGLRRFKSSAVISARINHANVAKTLDYVEEEGTSYLIEELVLGDDLGTFFPKRIPLLPPSAVARVFHQLARGLAASHDAGVMHRDLKPSNIMIVGGHRLAGVKITDFGIAKMAEAEIGEWATEGGGTTSKTVLGAIPYMAPESITDFKSATKSSDIWSIAAIAYELLAGHQPFGKGLVSVAAILKAEPPEDPRFISQVQFRTLGNDLMNIIKSCLVLDQSARPSADQLTALLETLCYSVDEYETGSVSRLHTRNIGFIVADEGNDVMYHTDSFYGPSQPKVGDRIWFARHPGSGNDRAFPLVKMPIPSV